MWDAIGKAFEEHGALVIPLLLLAWMFYSLIWKVWQAAMRSKDEEIQRLVDERNMYQGIFFKDRLSSNVKAPEEDFENDGGEPQEEEKES